MFHEKGDWRREQKSAFARGFLAELTVLRLLRGNAPIRHALHLLKSVLNYSKTAILIMC